ncbi:MAG: Rod shape-determining protein RodA, partial [Alphaproteobacteria bacterium MarineAlpha5_Bin10]
RSFSNFGRLVSLGVATNLFINIFFNTSMVTGLMPVVGIPLPLLSYGGSAMLSVMISFGFLLNISAHSGQKNLEYD